MAIRLLNAQRYSSLVLHDFHIGTERESIWLHWPLPLGIVTNQAVRRTTTSYPAQASTSILSPGPVTLISSTLTKFPRSSLRMIFSLSTLVVPRANL